jgi:hypothetical protein
MQIAHSKVRAELSGEIHSFFGFGFQPENCEDCFSTVLPYKYTASRIGCVIHSLFGFGFQPENCEDCFSTVLPHEYTVSRILVVRFTLFSVLAFSLKKVRRLPHNEATLYEYTASRIEW